MPKQKRIQKRRWKQFHLNMDMPVICEVNLPSDFVWKILQCHERWQKSIIIGLCTVNLYHWNAHTVTQGYNKKMERNGDTSQYKTGPVDLRPIYTKRIHKRKRKISLVFVVYSLIFFCLSFDFSLTFSVGANRTFMSKKHSCDLIGIYFYLLEKKWHLGLLSLKACSHRTKTKRSKNNQKKSKKKFQIFALAFAFFRCEHTLRLILFKVQQCDKCKNLIRVT